MIDLFLSLLADRPELSILQDSAAWKIVKDNAGRYGVAGLVAFAARSHVSPTERAWCDRVLINNWTRHERMLRHLEFVLGVLAEGAIPAISLKGPLLAQRYYTPPFLRKPSSDLDLAVRDRDLEAACRVLMQAGYTPDMHINEAKAISHHIALSHPSRPTLELHFRLSHQNLGIPVDQFFERTVSCRLANGHEALILSPADQLLHLALHLVHARFGTPFYLCELRRACRAQPPGVLAEAVQRAIDHHFSGVLRMIDVAFRARWSESFLPPEVALPKTWLNWRLDETLYDAFERSSEPGLGLTLPVRLRGRWLEFQITDTPSDALRSIGLLVRTARYRIGRGMWGNLGDIAYGPDYSR